MDPMLYKNALKPILFQFDPEDVHDFFTNTGEILGWSFLTRSLTSLIYGYKGDKITKTVDGNKYRTPFLLSAGFDYNGHLTRILPQIGLGGEEIGSVTARPCEGNDKPRLTRLPKNKSIIVNKGLRNDGVDAVIKRLKVTPREKDFVLGVSIARTNDSRSVPERAGIEDYAYSLEKLTKNDVGDYYTINISCPNAFGGEAFTTPVLLDHLLYELRLIKTTKPIYVKMPINLSWDKFQELLKIIEKMGLDGVVIGNLNKDYAALQFRDEAPKTYEGGLSGKPCAHLSTDLIHRTRQAYGNRFTIIGVGGVMDPKSAEDKFQAGADLIQLITGMIYEGPGLIRKLCKDYEKSVRKDQNGWYR
jgi:dihydroorotate dehydrogenase subfamily 2